MSKKLQDLLSSLRYLPRSLEMTWEAARIWTIVWFILLLVQGILPAASVYLTKLVVDGFVVATDSGGVVLHPLITAAVALGVVMLLSQVLQHVIGWVRIAQSEHFSDYIHSRIHSQAALVDLAYYESTEYYDRLHRVLADASSRPLSLLETIGALLQNTVTLLAMAALLIPYGAWLPLVLVASTLPAFWVLTRYNKRYHGWWMRRTEDRRRVQYYNSVVTTSYFAPEVRLFGLGPRFAAAYADIRTYLRRERLRIERDQVIGRIIAGLLALVAIAATMVWMAWRAISGTGTLGDLALFYRALDKGQNLMRGVIGSVGQIHNNTLFLANLFEFLDQKPEVVSPQAPKRMPNRVHHELRLENVTFYYPDATRPALRDFNLTIPAGRTVAIVGENGAGKSTLVKLLTRFYDPTGGRVTLDGTDVREFPLEELRHNISVLFQFPVQFQATAAESIAMGDVSRPFDLERVRAAAAAAGIHEKILALPDGYETQIGRWFSQGVELSGGEWQRLAMARAFYRDAPVVILDEPTSMMDSWAEAEWFDRFASLAKDAVALIITHRFTIARRADLIHVMKDGAIVESGTHDELVRKGGFYMASWSAQTETPELELSEAEYPAADGAVM